MKTLTRLDHQINGESSEKINRVNILGVGVSAIDLDKAIDIIKGWIDNGEQHYICVTGVHGVIESQRDDLLRRIHNNANLVTPDGMPLVWLSRLFGYRRVSRVYGPDLLSEVCGNSYFRTCSHFFYGSTDIVLEHLSENLKKKFPDIEIVGVHSPPFRELTTEEEKQIIAIINQKKPDFLWVGLSTPKQEKWMSDHMGKFDAQIMIGVGAAFDFHAGIKNQAPLWMQKSGLEWFFRLITEPRRLWRRYLINNSLFIVLILAQILGVKKYSLS